MIDDWKPMVYGGNTIENYEVSPSGKIRNAKTHRVYKTHINKRGYETVCLSAGSRSKQKCVRVHKAVAETYLDNDGLRSQVNHIDGNKTNNHVCNLEWVTPSENMIHAYSKGLARRITGFSNPRSRLTHMDVQFIRESYVPGHKEFGSRALGRKFNIDHMAILNVVKCKTYIRN